MDKPRYDHGQQDAERSENVFTDVAAEATGFWKMCAKQVERATSKKRNWSAPGPDHIANFWWKRVNCLHSGIAKSFQAFALEDQDIPLWFTGG